MVTLPCCRRAAVVAVSGLIGLGCLGGLASAQPGAGALASFKAAGHDPGWTLDVGGGRMVLVAEDGATTLEMPLPAPAPVEGGRRYEVRSDAHTVRLTILERVCADTMTGMPRPATVEVTLDGRVLTGCGGDPTSLLRGGLWLVSQINQQPIVKMSRVTLAFGASGRVAGAASCNTYGAMYVLTGEGLSITMPIASMRSCEAPYMAQEALFLEILRGVNRFELGGDGTLTLHAADGGSIIARREQATLVAPKKPARPR